MFGFNQEYVDKKVNEARQRDQVTHAQTIKEMSEEYGRKLVIAIADEHKKVDEARQREQKTIRGEMAEEYNRKLEKERKDMIEEHNRKLVIEQKKADDAQQREQQLVKEISEEYGRKLEKERKEYQDKITALQNEHKDNMTTQHESMTKDFEEKLQQKIVNKLTQEGKELEKKPRMMVKAVSTEMKGKCYVNFAGITKGLDSNWSIKNEDVEDFNPEFKKYSKVFVIGTFKTGKSTICEFLRCNSGMSADEVNNTKGQILFPRMISKSGGKASEPILLIDTEGLFQPIEGADPDFLKQILLEQIMNLADMVIMVVDHINSFELEFLKDLASVYDSSRILKKIFVVHNLKTITEEKKLMEYINQVKGTLALTDNIDKNPYKYISDYTRNGMITKREAKETTKKDDPKAEVNEVKEVKDEFLDEAMKIEEIEEIIKPIHHIFFKKITDFKNVDSVTMALLEDLVTSIPAIEEDCSFINNFKKSILNISSKYYYLEDPKQSLILQRRTKSPNELVFVYNEKMTPRIPMQNWSLWDPKPIKVNVNLVTKTKMEGYETIILPIELECPGLQLDTIKLDFKDDSTINISGKKNKIGNQMLEINHTFKTRNKISVDMRGMLLTTASIHLNNNLNIQIHIVLNASPMNYPNIKVMEEEKRNYIADFKSKLLTLLGLKDTDGLKYKLKLSLNILIEEYMDKTKKDT